MLPPQKHTFDTVWGHEAARRFVPRLLGAGRLPHAILLTGPDGIGKRSLAFAMAKAIMSAGIAARGGKVDAPGPAMAKRTITADGDDDDLFGDQDDLFGGATEEVDLFGDAAEEEPAVGEPESAPEAEQPTPTPPKSVKDSPKHSLSKAGSTIEATRFVGFDERISRLIENSYPTEYDTSGRPKNLAHADLYIIEPPGNRRSILVDQVRAFHEAASIPPVEGAFRVVLIFGADTITQEAGNSILKLLEEPPRYLVMILVANQLSRVLPTIKSRCSIVPMTPLGKSELVTKLVEEEGVGRDHAKVAAALSEGRPGVALEVLSGDLLKKRRDVFEARLQLDRFGQCALPGAASRISSSGELEDVLWLLLSFARDRLVNQTTPDHPELLVHGDVSELITTVGDSCQLDEEAERLLDAYGMLRHPFIPNQRAVMETALWFDE